MTKLERWKLEYGCIYPHELGEVCLSDDVARLEASHAELLAVVKEFVRYSDEDGPLYFPVDEMWVNARAAIAKAEETKGEPT